MGDYKRILLLISIMTVVAASIGIVAIMVLYETAFEEERLRLVETAQSQARLMEAVARFDQAFSRDYPQGAKQATISQIRDAHRQYLGFGDTGEFTLARREGDDIVFVLSHRHSDLDNPEPVPFDSNLAQPMRQALSGQSGTVIGPDYRDVTVLAAHEPVAVLDLGIVAKIDLAEIRAPFQRAAGIVVAIAIVLIAGGTMLFFRVSNPIIRRIRESEERLKTILDTTTSLVILKDLLGRHMLINRQYEVATGFDENEVLGKTDHGFLPREVADRLRSADKEVLESGKSLQLEETIPGPQGMRHYVTTKVPIKDHSGRLYALCGIATDITERKQAEEALTARVRQQAAVADLGRRTLAGAAMDTLFGEAVTQVSNGLRVGYAEVLELLPDGRGLLLRAGVGWKEKDVGKATLSAGRDSQAGFTLLSRKPVIVKDLRTETRFTGSPLLRDHGIVSGVSVLIQGKDRPFGVLGAHTSTRRAFSTEDINFLRAIANVLAECVERDRAEHALKEAHESLELRVKERTTDLIAANQSLQQQIHARQEAEEALRASKQRYAKAAEIAHFGYWERDLIRSTALWSNEVYRIFGVDPGHLDGAYESFLALIHPDDRERLRRAVDTAISHKEQLDIEYRIGRPDGAERVIHSVAEVSLNHAGQGVGLHGIVHDITQRKQAEEGLRQSLRDQEIIASILRASLRSASLDEMLQETLVLVLTSRELGLEHKGCVFLVDDESNELVLKARHGLPDSIMDSCARVAFGQCICGRAAETRSLLHVDRVDSRHGLSYPGMTPHGHYCAPIQSGGEVLGVLNLFVPQGHQSTDIGARFVTAIADTLAGIIRRRRAEEQSRAHQAELAHVTRLSTVGEMATGIAHEVNQPLTAMVTLSQACLRMTESGTVDFDKVREGMREVAKQGLRAGEIIRRLREFTRMRETKRTTADPNDLVQEPARFVEAEALENGINIKLELGAELPKVLVDTIQVEQVILNLLRNAMEAMEGTAADQHLLTVQTRKNKAGMVELSVSDTGPGLSQETANRIFDAFFTTKSHGMGMGLSISRSIIEAHKGCLWADGLLGDGATFHFTLPSASQGNRVDH